MSLPLLTPGGRGPPRRFKSCNHRAHLTHLIPHINPVKLTTQNYTKSPTGIILHPTILKK